MSLKIENLNKKFGRKTIFQNFNYCFNDTGIYVLSAASGVGKTTLLRIIAGLDNNYSGTVTGGGFSNISFAFQEYRLFDNLTVLDNVSEVSFKDNSEDRKQRSREILKRLGFLEEELVLYPNALSGGMKQRVSLARAIAKESPVLLLDEPEKELDYGLQKKVYQIIREEGKKRLVILVTHADVTMEIPEATVVHLVNLHENFD